MRTVIAAAGFMVIIGGAAAVRFIDLDTNPGGLFRDEASEALSGQRILHDPEYRPVFIPEGGGREPLFAYVVAAAFGIMGETTLTLRSVAAAFGVAGVAAIWLAGRRFGAMAAWVAAAWAAGSLWLICVSRDGMRNAIVPLFAALAIAAILAWARRPTSGRALVAGATLAIASLYTYQPLKLLPIVVLAWLASLFWRNRVAFDRLGRSPLMVAAGFLVMGGPIIVYALSHPAIYAGRAIDVSIFAEPNANVGSHVIRTLGMFAFAGDLNPRHDVAALPMLGVPLSLLGIAGMVRAWRLRSDASHAFLLWSLPIFLLPPLLASEGPPPHFLRALGLAVPVAITLGLGATELAERAAQGIGPRSHLAVGSVVALGLAALGLASATTYLSRPVADRYEAYEFDVVAMSDLATGKDVLLLGPPDQRIVEFLRSDALQLAVPGTPVRVPSNGRLLALSLADLDASVGRGVGADAVAIAISPSGQPSVWALVGAPAP